MKKPLLHDKEKEEETILNKQRLNLTQILQSILAKKTNFVWNLGLSSLNSITDQKLQSLE